MSIANDPLLTGDIFKFVFTSLGKIIGYFMCSVYTKTVLLDVVLYFLDFSEDSFGSDNYDQRRQKNKRGTFFVF